MQSCWIELCVVPLLLISGAFCLPNDTATTITTVEYVSENSTSTDSSTGTEEEIECKSTFL